MPQELPTEISPELQRVFVEEVFAIPGGEKIKTCIQCGTCSASCPTAYAMDYTPRQIICFFRAGLLDRVLRSNTVWMCASCYNCHVRCPAGIKLTDVMYELKRLGIKYGIYPEGEKAPALSTSFEDVVERYGRNFETQMMAKYSMRAGPMNGIKMLPLAIRMFRRGRVKLSAQEIPQHDDLQKMIDAAESEEAGR